MIWPRREYFDAISRRNDDVDGIAGRESEKLAYGAQNPYARVAEYKTVAAVTRQDLLDWHHAHVSPNNIILGIVGDFDSAAMEAKLRQIYGAWPKGPALKEEKIEFQPAKPGYYLVQKDDVNQSTINMVGVGITRDNPDYYAVRVFNEAFGGGFSSRLFRTIRTEKGLAYAVGGGIGSGFDHPGMVRLSMGTKSATTLESIQALDEQIDDVAKHPITEAEIKRAKDSILNSFVFNLDSPDKILRERMAYEFYGYPQDYLEKFRARSREGDARGRGPRCRQISAQGQAGHAGSGQSGRVRQAAVVAGSSDHDRHHDSAAPGRATGSGGQAGRSSNERVRRTRWRSSAKSLPSRCISIRSGSPEPNPFAIVRSPALWGCAGVAIGRLSFFPRLPLPEAQTPHPEHSNINRARRSAWERRSKRHGCGALHPDLAALRIRLFLLPCSRPQQLERRQKHD